MAPRVRLAWLVVFLVVQALYFPINRSVRGGLVLATPWDAHIPLWPIWALPYLLGLAWWAGCFVWAARKMDDDLYKAFITSLVAVNLVSYTIYLLYPTYVVRPSLEGDGWPMALMRLIYSQDRAYNAFPSGHTFTTVLIALFWWRWRPRWRWLWAGIAGVILLSTLFTRQHNLPDLVAGVVLAGMGYGLGLYVVGRREVGQVEKRLWFWRGVWALCLALGLGLGALYTWLPADGATGDLESFTPQGYRVQWLFETREGGLRVGDLIVRAGGHTVDEWLGGARRGPEWRAGGIVTYEIERDGQALSLPIRLAPVPFEAFLARWGLQVVAVLALVALGSFVFWKRPYELAARLLMLFCLMVALQLWGDGYNFQYAILPWRWPLWYHLILEHVVYGLTFALLCHFALVFPVPLAPVKRFPRLALLAVYAVNPLVVLVTMALSSWSVGLEMGNRVAVAVSIFQAALIIGAFVASVRAARDPITRTQVRWILWSVSVIAVVGITTYYLPLVLTGTPLLPHPLAMLLLALVPLVCAVAILRYRLFDIEVIINRSLVYAVLTALLAGLYLVLVRLLTSLIQDGLGREDDSLVIFIATLSVALAFAPLRQRVQVWIDRAFYRTRLDYRQLLPEMSARVSASIMLDQLGALLTGELPRRLQIERATLAVLETLEGRFIPLGDAPAHQALPMTHPLVVYLERHGQSLLRLQPPLDLPAGVQAFLDQGGIEVCIPLVAGANLVGLYSLGRKSSGGAYSRKEVRMLHILGQQAAVSVENARLYRQVEDHSRTLEAQVQQRTFELEIAYRELAEQHAQLDVILRNVADGLVVTDMDDRVILVNPTFANILRRSSDELVGRELAGVFADEGLWRAVAGAREVTHGVVTADVSLSEQVYRASACALVDVGSQRRIGVVTILRDVTHEIAVARLKDSFVSMVSHELRTPLTSVLGFARLIHKQFERNVKPSIALHDIKGQQAAQRILDNLQIIIAEGRRLTRLINNVLDIAKMEAGEVQWEMGEVALADVVQSSVDAIRSLAQEEDLPVQVEVQDGLAPVYGDQDRLIQVLTNLLSNAIKFTDRGHVQVRVWSLLPGDDVPPFGVRSPDARVEFPAREPLLVVSVRDTGIGIAEENLSQVFERFRQVGDRVDGTRRAGTGLGLSICREIVAHHGGHLWVESRLGEGSRFVFTLPVKGGEYLR
jgi:signal transduction histidine kinase